MLKMKKVFAVFLTLVMLVASSGAVASAKDLSGITSEDINTHIHPSYAEKSALSDADVQTTDIVTEEDGILTVETDFGLKFTYKLSEDVNYLTQDLQHDLLTYLNCYNEPVETVRHFIEDEMHLNIYTTTDQCLDIFFYAFEGTDKLSEIIVDANDLTEKEAEAIIDVLSNAFETNFEFGSLGDQNWFIGDALEEYNMLIGVTYVGGHMIEATLRNIASDDDIETILNMLGSVSLSMNEE